MSDIQYGVAWQDSFRLGNEMVDAQHFQIFQLLSELVGSCIDGSDVGRLKSTLDFLVDYTVRHFQEEESLQIQCGYPDYARHKQLHEAFIVEVSKIVERFEKDGSSTALSRDLNKIVIHWLINHIMQEDKKIGEHLRKQQAQADVLLAL